MQEEYPLLDKTDMLVLASPIYCHGFSWQFPCAVNRIYALDKLRQLRKAALVLASGSEGVHSGAVYEYENSFISYPELEDVGIYTASEDAKNLAVRCAELHSLGQGLNGANDENGGQ